MWPSALCGLTLLLLQLAGCSAKSVLGISPKERKMAIQAWRAFLKEPNGGVDLMLDAIKSYPDADRVLGSLSRETGLPEGRLGEALKPLATNLLLNYSKIFALLSSEPKLRRYMERMRTFYKDKHITEDEYETLNELISHHVSSELSDKFSEEQLASVGHVLDTIKKGIFQSS